MHIRVTVLILISILVTTQTAEAIGRFGKKRMRLKIEGQCDQYFNNLPSAPEMIGAVPNGTSCKAVVKIWKRTATGRVPLKGKRIEIGEQLARNGIFSEVGYGTTNSRGRTAIDFVWSTDSCAYNAFLGDADTFSLGLSELVIFDDLIQFPEACQGDV